MVIVSCKDTCAFLSTTVSASWAFLSPISYHDICVCVCVYVCNEYQQNGLSWAIKVENSKQLKGTKKEGAFWILAYHPNLCFCVPMWFEREWVMFSFSCLAVFTGLPGVENISVNCVCITKTLWTNLNGLPDDTAFRGQHRKCVHRKCKP